MYASVPMCACVRVPTCADILLVLEGYQSLGAILDKTVVSTILYVTLTHVTTSHISIRKL